MQENNEALIGSRLFKLKYYSITGKISIFIGYRELNNEVRFWIRNLSQLILIRLFNNKKEQINIIPIS
jgi:hypothetical protein